MLRADSRDCPPLVLAGPSGWGPALDLADLSPSDVVQIGYLEEAVLRRFASLGRDDRVLARKLDIAYRKPCFAGDRMRVHVQPLEHEGMLGAICAIAPEGSPTSEARAVARLLFG